MLQHLQVHGDGSLNRNHKRLPRYEVGGLEGQDNAERRQVCSGTHNPDIPYHTLQKRLSNNSHQTVGYAPREVIL